MKTIKYIYVTLSCILFFFTSCNNNEFLEEEPKTLYTLTNAFEKSSQVEAQLTMCYYDSYTIHNFYFGNSIGNTKSSGTDAMDKTSWRVGGSGNSNFSNWSSTSGDVETVWNKFYQIISYANLTFLGTESESIVWDDEDYKTRLKAEASFFRGMSYLRLSELFGGVPLVIEFNEELKFDYVRSTREESYRQAINDLEYAFVNLPDYPLEDGRVAKGAAGHMLAEAYLAMGVETSDNSNYSKAITYANATVALHPLMTDRFGVRANPSDASTNRGVATYLPDGNVYGDLFYSGNYDFSVGNTEAVWTIQTPTYQQEDETGGQFTWEPFLVGPALRDLNWKPEFAEEDAANGPWKAISPEYSGGAIFPAYLGGFGISIDIGTKYANYEVWTDLDDLRYKEDVTVRVLFDCTDPNHSMYGQKVPMSMIDQAGFSKYAPLFAKIIPLDEWSYKSSDAMHYGANHDIYGIRSAETYLLLAEAYLRNSQPELSVDAINVVRGRAGCALLSNIDIDDILDERLRELLFEEGRWFTLLRMEPEMWKQRLYDHAMYISEFNVYTLDIKFDLWPIPEKVIQLNQDAEFPQNIGWE